MMIARFGMAAACGAMVALSGSPVAAQGGATAPQTQYQQYQPPQNQAPPYQAPSNGPPAQQYQPQPSSAPQAPPQPPPQPPPFVLSSQQKADLDRVLDDWERHSDKVTKFQCEYTHWTYDPTFLPPTLGANGELDERPIKTSVGDIKYSAPDKGLIRDKDVKEITNPGTPGEKEVKRDYGEHWACDGKILSAVDHSSKRAVHRTKLPPEMQGKFISEGPLPFAFGAKAAPLKARYYLRIITPPDKLGQVWLEVRPRFQKDMTNFIEVEVVLRTPDMLPVAIQITHAEVKVPIQTKEGQKIAYSRLKDVYVFNQTKWSWLPDIFGDDFLPHPWGYTIIDEPMPGQAPANNSQARRPWPSIEPVQLH
jgi:TIGR03009 family protein